MKENDKLRSISTLDHMEMQKMAIFFNPIGAANQINCVAHNIMEAQCQLTIGI